MFLGLLYIFTGFFLSFAHLAIRTSTLFIDIFKVKLATPILNYKCFCYLYFNLGGNNFVKFLFQKMFHFLKNGFHIWCHVENSLLHLKVIKILLTYLCKIVWFYFIIFTEKNYVFTFKSYYLLLPCN